MGILTEFEGQTAVDQFDGFDAYIFDEERMAYGVYFNYNATFEIAKPDSNADNPTDYYVYELVEIEIVGDTIRLMDEDGNETDVPSTEFYDRVSREAVEQLEIELIEKEKQEREDII